MEQVSYVKVNPNKNTTILVLNEYSRARYPQLAKQLMSSESIYAEQVGFVEGPSDPRACCRLHMMGGEFCANAAASLSAYLAYERRELAGPGKTCFKLEVSGADCLIECEVQKREKGYRIQVLMPLPSQIREGRLTYQGSHVEFGIVEFPGTCHAIICDESQNQQSKALARHILHREMENSYSVKGATLFSKQQQSILPLIYVKETDTEIWENSCGAASAALAVYMARKQKKDIAINVAQPSGDYVQARAAYDDGAISKVSIEEDVFLSSIGIAFI